MKAAISVIGLCFGLLAAVSLYYASIETPWKIQSIGGQTETERRFRRQRARWARIGFVLLGLAFFCQLVSTFMR